MFLDLGKPVGRILRRRLCSGVTLLAYLVAAIGAPVPETSGQTPNACGQQVCCCGTPEQCQASGCGCPHRGKTPDQEEAPPSCCSHESKKPAANSSCCVRENSPSSEPPSAPSKPKPNTLRWMIGISAQKCRGGATTWLNAAPALPMQAPLCWLPSWPYCHSLPITHEHPFVLSMDLLDPPPRSQAV